MNRQEVLDTAGDIIVGQRQEDYGSAKDSFTNIAALWTWYLGTHVSAVDVAQMMTLLKISRERTGAGSTDNFIDAIGYQALAAEIKGEKDAD